LVWFSEVKLLKNFAAIEGNVMKDKFVVTESSYLYIGWNLVFVRAIKKKNLPY
jgi:hypothetical protein